MNSKNIVKVFNHPDIKEFINAYSVADRPEAVKIALLHSIFSFKASFKSYPSLDQLKDTISNAGKIINLEGIISSMKNKLEKLKKEIFTMEDNISKTDEKKPVLNKFSSGFKENNVRSMSAPHLRKAPSDWRQGDKTIFRKGFVENENYTRKPYPNSPTNIRIREEFLQDTNNLKQQNVQTIYPEWWLALSELHVKPTKLPEKVTSFIPPLPKHPVERKQWVEPYVWHQDSAKPPAKKIIKFSPRTSEKSAEANFESLDSSQGRVRFSDKNYSGWVGDYTKEVKNNSFNYLNSPW